ncbi:MAG: CorA family divalent cation transporter [Aestuariivirga sp.]
MQSSPPLATLDQQGLVFARSFDADGRATALAIASKVLPNGQAEWIWVHLDLVDRRAALWLSNLQLPKETAQEFLSDDIRPRIEHQGKVVYGMFSEMSLEPSSYSDRARLLRFIVGEHWIITGRHHPLQSVENLRLKIDGGQRAHHPAEILEMIVEASVDGIQHDVNAMLAHVNRVEDIVIDRGGTRSGGEIAAIRRKVVTIHREISIYKALFRRFAEYNAHMNFPAAVCEAAQGAVQKIDTLHGEVHALQERARLLKDEISANVASDINNSLYILSLVSALLLPPSLIFGLFGVNVGGLPLIGSDLGFAVVVGIGLLSSGLVFALMRRRN